MRVLAWHVHGSWMTAFVHGGHDYVVPRTPSRDADGLGRARTYQWPESAVEVPADRLREEDFDVVVLQRPHERELCRRWTGRTPGVDVRAVYVEHNTPGDGAVTTVHHLADQTRIPIVHVTHFNQLMWDSGRAPTLVIEHGIVDPGYRYTGEVARAAVVVNDPVRRGRAVGTDLLPGFAAVGGLDAFGIGTEQLTDGYAWPAGRVRTFGDIPQARMHAELARRRVYLHLHRWTSLGLSLLEAMHLGLPVVALATTEAVAAVPAAAGQVATNPAQLRAAVRHFLDDPQSARVAGLAAREAALSGHGLKRFLRAWDDLLLT